MKMTPYEIVIVLVAAVILSGCNPSKLSSHYSLDNTSKIAKASPEKEAINVEQKIALYTQALEKLNKKVTYLSVENAAKTNWTYLGYQIKLATTDARGNVVNHLSRANTKLSFSDLQIDSCPTGMMCTLVYQPYVTAQINSECQSASYRMQESFIVGTSMSLESNYFWTVVAGEKTPNCTGTEEKEFFTDLSSEIIRNDLLIFVSDNFLYIQSNGLTFFFTK